MRSKLMMLVLAASLIFTLASVGFGQGKGKGNSGGKGKSGSVDRGKGSGKGTSDDSIFGGRSDDKKNKDKENRGKGGDNGGVLDSNKDKGSSNRFKGLSKKTGVSEDALRARYDAEKRLNPDLTYGQFVAAHVLAKNHDGISTERILNGLRNGDSIGQTLHNEGWDNDKIKKERKRIKKDRDKDKDKDYDDDDQTWRTPF